jgi:hypothetical protein
VNNKLASTRESTHIPEFIQTILVDLAHFGGKCYCCEQHAVVSISEKILGFRDKVISKVRDLLDDAKSTQGSLEYILV